MFDSKIQKINYYITVKFLKNSFGKKLLKDNKHKIKSTL